MGKINYLTTEVSNEKYRSIRNQLVRAENLLLPDPIEFTPGLEGVFWYGLEDPATKDLYLVKREIHWTSEQFKSFKTNAYFVDRCFKIVEFFATE